MFQLFVNVLALLPILGAVAAPAQKIVDVRRRETVPPPVGYNISAFGVNGSGCPPGTAIYAISEDRSSVTVSFSNYWAEIGPGKPFSASRKNCQLTFNVDVPTGYTFGLTSVDYRGYFQLEDGVTAHQNANYYCQGKTDQITAGLSTTGPVEGNYYTFRDKFGLGPAVISPCGMDVVLNVASDIRLTSTNSSATGYIATDSIDTSYKTVFNFVWEKCEDGVIIPIPGSSPPPEAPSTTLHSTPSPTP